MAQEHLHGTFIAVTPEEFAQDLVKGLTLMVNVTRPIIGTPDGLERFQETLRQARRTPPGPQPPESERYDS